MSLSEKIVAYLEEVLGNPKEIERGPLVSLIGDAINDATPEQRWEFLRQHFPAEELRAGLAPHFKG